MINKKTALLWAVILIIISSVVTYSITNTFAIKLGEKVVVKKSEYEKLEDLKKLVLLKDYINGYYVEGTDDDILIEGAMKGMFEALGDPYSEYMSKDEFKIFNESTKGAFGGIGVIVTRSEEGYITVVAPIEDAPGERVGLKTNDKIVKVDDKDIVGVELEKAVSLMRGKPGTKVTITVVRENVKQHLTFEIKREQILEKSVKTKMLDNKIGYLRISMFDEDTGKEFKNALTSLKTSGAKGLIIDLRQNPGGFVTQCIEVADELLDKGLIVYTEDKYKARQEYYSNDGKIQMPFVLLVDEGSASASEILSGAIKDREAGLLIGTKTFGKGLVQSVESLKDGSGFKLTTQKYYTPNGMNINKVGIQPDIEVKLPEIKEGQKVEDIKDTQLDKAIEEITKQIR